MKKGFLRGAGILAIATLIAKIIGAFYRIPLTNALGAEGMGIYQLIFPVYSMILSSSSGSLPIAISVLVSGYIAKNQHQEARDILHSAMSVLLMTGIILSLALVTFAGTIGRLQGNEQAKLGYMAIAPAIFFVSGIAVLRGWYQGNGLMSPSALSQVIESIFKLSIGLTLAIILKPFGLHWAVFGALAGVTASEAMTFIVLYIMYRRKNPPFRLSLNWKESRKRYRAVLRISFPMTIGGMILPFTQIIDSLLVINILARTMQQANATISYGLFTGYVSTLINMPIVLGLSLGIAVVPQLSKGRAERNISAVKQKSDTAMKLALMIGVPFAFLYLTMPKGILLFLYPSLSPSELSEAAMLLQIGAGSVIALSITQIYTSILQGLGETYEPVKNMGIGAALKIALNLILLPTIGITGVAYASLACFVLTAILNFLSVYRLMGKSMELYKNSGIILLSGVIMGAVVWLINYLTVGKMATILVFLFGGMAYFVFLLLFRAFSENELLSLPFGEKLVTLTKQIKPRG